jgi:hypothetical protein
MVLIPCILLAVFAPGYLFPQMAARMSAPGRVGLSRAKGGKTEAEKQSQAEGLRGQQLTTSGDESAVGEERAKEQPASTTAVVEPSSKESA